MDFSNDKSGWKTVPDMKTPRNGSFAWADNVNMKIYVAGGVAADGGEPLNTVEVLDAKTNTWSAGGIFFILNFY
jgi:hypothetical protein